MKKLIVLFVVMMIVLTGCGTQTLVNNEPAIQAIGLGKITTEPDEVQVQFSVVTQGNDKLVQEKNAIKAQQIIEALISLGLTKAEMETKNINFNPVYNWEKEGGNKVVGYRAENTILIKTKQVDKASQIIDTAVNKGAELVGNLQYSLSDEGKENLLDKAIEKAVQDARKQADATAKAAGVKIIGIKMIEVQKNEGNPNVIYFEKRKASDTNTPIIPQDADYIVTVRAEFKIK